MPEEVCSIEYEYVVCGATPSPTNNSNRLINLHINDSMMLQLQPTQVFILTIITKNIVHTVYIRQICFILFCFALFCSVSVLSGYVMGFLL